MCCTPLRASNIAARRRLQGLLCSEDEASWGRSQNEEWHESVSARVRSWLWLNVLLSGGKTGRRGGRWGSAESVTQLSAGVMFNWINLLWNVQALPGLMPCVHWRLERRAGGWGSGGGDPWGGDVLKQDLKRRNSPKGSTPSCQATLSPLYCSVWTYSSTHASAIKTQDKSPVGQSVYSI